MHHDTSNRLDAAQIARLSPETVAAAAARFSRDAAGGDHAAHVAREALLDAWREHRGLDTRAQAVADLMAVEIGRYSAARGKR